MVGSLLISGRGWLWPMAIFLAFALGLIAWAYRRETANPAVRAACAALKLLGLLTLAACVLEPLWSGQRARPGANLFVILADNSESLSIRDPRSEASRGVEMKKLLTQ